MPKRTDEELASQEVIGMPTHSTISLFCYGQPQLTDSAVQHCSDDELERTEIQSYTNNGSETISPQ